jgi:hypothetical protein
VARIVVVSSLDRTTLPPVTVVAPGGRIRVSSSESGTGPSTIHLAAYVPSCSAVTSAVTTLVSRGGLHVDFEVLAVGRQAGRSAPPFG